MADHRVLKDVLEYNNKPDQHPADKEKPGKMPDEDKDGSTPKNSEHIDAEKKERILKRVELDRPLSRQQTKILDQQILTDPDFKRRYVEAGCRLTRKKRMAVQKRKVASIDSYIAKYNPELSQLLKKRQTMTGRSEPDQTVHFSGALRLTRDTSALVLQLIEHLQATPRAAHRPAGTKGNNLNPKGFESHQHQLSLFFI